MIGAIAGLDADVTSIEAARSHMEVLADLDAAGFDLGVGPGVYDIHSPRVPTVEEITTALHAALKVVPPERLWVNRCLKCECLCDDSSFQAASPCGGAVPV